MGLEGGGGVGGCRVGGGKGVGLEGAESEEGRGRSTRINLKI